MSIIIKGLDMPSSCYMCWVNHYCEAIINPPIARANGRGEHCPLVEIPKGHGRLIDYDRWLDDFMKYDMPNLSDPPTILEAEENEEMEEWNSYSHGKIYAPKGTFQKILEAGE